MQAEDAAKKLVSDAQEMRRQNIILQYDLESFNIVTKGIRDKRNQVMNIMNSTSTRAATENLNLQNHVRKAINHDGPLDSEDEREFLNSVATTTMAHFHGCTPIFYICGNIQHLQRALQIYFYHRSMLIRQFSLDVAERTSCHIPLNTTSLNNLLERHLSVTEYQMFKELTSTLAETLPNELAHPSITAENVKLQDPVCSNPIEVLNEIRLKLM
eukprot:GHVH01011233.1.p2 GENE.GHVH01011233.1~~GHVH01011233.1.p2  ORF type:complete len:226 (+),score=28.45 GHVH01011233.1:38-679(+)